MSKRTKIILAVVFAFIFVFMLSGCFPGDGTNDAANTAGFFRGVWHGWIAPLALIVSLFRDTGIYEVYNNGFAYNLGFYMAVISGFGGLAIFRGRD